MAAWTLTEAKSHLAAWVEADLALATSKSYKMGSKELTRADSDEIAARIAFWRKEVIGLESGKTGVRSIRVVVRDL